MTRKGRFYIKKQQIHCRGERGAGPRARSVLAGRGVRAGPPLAGRRRPAEPAAPAGRPCLTKGVLVFQARPRPTSPGFSLTSLLQIVPPRGSPARPWAALPAGSQGRKSLPSARRRSRTGWRHLTRVEGRWPRRQKKREPLATLWLAVRPGTCLCSPQRQRGKTSVS